MEIKVSINIQGIKEKEHFILQEPSDMKRLIKERSTKDGKCKHGTPNTHKHTQGGTKSSN
jgi:hypothetical protein